MNSLLAARIRIIEDVKPKQEADTRVKLGPFKNPISMQTCHNLRKVQVSNQTSVEIRMDHLRFGATLPVKTRDGTSVTQWESQHQ